MFAVIRTGGKQYCVGTGDVISVEKLTCAPDSKYVFDDVLMIGDGETVTLAASKLKTARVEAELVRQERADKITTYKSRQRNTYRRKLGHRQDLSRMKITAISTSTAPTKAQTPQTEAKTVEKTTQAPETIADTPQAAKAAKPARTKAQTKSKVAPADDLTQLKGIGPALASKLNGAGLTRFEQIAALNKDRIADIEQKLKISGRFAANDWVEQAKALK